MDSDLKLEISLALETFCSFSSRFYESVPVLLSSQMATLGFTASPSIINDVPPVQKSEFFRALGQSLQNVVPTLLPGPTFNDVRTQLRMKIQKAVISSQIVPPNTVLNIFGSSQNNFGSEGADIDMCLSYPGCQTVSKEEKTRMIEAIADFLKIQMGMLEVQARSTARIPIVIFKDVESGLDCGKFMQICNVESNFSSMN
jgi:terminal uridylyltransferase